MDQNRFSYVRSVDEIHGQEFCVLFQIFLFYIAEPEADDGVDVVLRLEE